MLKSAMYLNFFIIFVLSIVFLVITFKKKTDLRKIRIFVCINILQNFINANLTFMEIVDIDWDFVVLIPVAILSLIINFVNLVIVHIKIKKSVNDENKVFSIKKFIALMMVPVLVFLIPYIYELYLLNSCDYIIKYRYDIVWMSTEETYIAIVDDKPVTITLSVNLFERNETEIEGENYHISYVNGVRVTTSIEGEEKVVEGEIINDIAADVAKRCPEAGGAYVLSLEEDDYVMVTVLAGERNGTVLGEYFYSKGVFVEEIETNGTLEYILHYE